MSHGDKPTYYVALKNKEDVKNKVAKPRAIFIADGWEGQYGFRISFRQERQRNDGTKSVGIAAIKLTDGTVINPNEWHVNMGRHKDAPAKATAPTNTYTNNADEDLFGGDDSSIPF